MRPYRPRWVNGRGLYRTPRACSQACRSPNRSKWLIIKVELTTTTQPAAYPAQSAAAPGPDRFQTVPPTGCHSQNSSASTRLAAKTNVARSAGAGTMRVQQRLNGHPGQLRASGSHPTPGRVGFVAPDMARMVGYVSLTP
jgi:hypothetical protein